MFGLDIVTFIEMLIALKTIFIFLNGPLPAFFFYFRIFNTVDSKCSI